MRDPLTIASRMANVKPSGIRRFFDLAQTMKNPVDLSIGQPHYDPPAPVVEAAIAAIRGGRNRYTTTQGIEPLRDKVREMLARSKGLTLGRDDDLLMTSGVAGGLMLAYLCILDPGDEILIPDPYFVMYRHLAHVAGATPVYYSTYPDFRLRKEALEAAVTDKTRAILVNSPANPTGYVMTEDEMRAVADVARRHGLLVISDEIYDLFVYDQSFTSPRHFYEHTLLLSGFSKSFGIPGWRIGYAAGPKRILDQMRMLQQFSYVCAPAPAQYGVLAGLDLDLSAWREEYRAKRDMIYQGLRARFEVVKPGGAFYCFPKLPHGVSDEAFVARCIEHETLVVPGSACSESNTHVRVSFAAADDILKRGIDVLNRVADSFR